MSKVFNRSIVYIATIQLKGEAVSESESFSELLQVKSGTTDNNKEK